MLNFVTHVMNPVRHVGNRDYFESERGKLNAVQTVFENLEAGMSVDEITEVFDVTAEEIKSHSALTSESLAKAPTFG